MRDMFDTVREMTDQCLEATEEDTGSESDDMLALQEEVELSPSKSSRPKNLPTLQIKSASV